MQSAITPAHTVDIGMELRYNFSMELSWLEQFVKIAECGTLSKAAEELFLSQPALTRSMQKLEQELGVELFSHGKNRLELNENGKFAYTLAQNVLRDMRNLREQIRQFDRSRRTISVGACAPAPLWEIMPLLTSLYPEKRLVSEVKSEEELEDGLLSGAYQMIITTENAENADIYSIFTGSEALLVNIPKLHPLAAMKGGVRFADMEKYSLLLYAKTGVWENIVRREMPNAHIIMQENRDSFEALKRESALLSFSTELSIKQFGNVDGAIVLPVSDESAKIDFYCRVLKKNKPLMREFLERYA